jgi:hypothetical protein
MHTRQPQCAGESLVKEKDHKNCFMDTEFFNMGNSVVMLPVKNNGLKLLPRFHNMNLIYGNHMFIQLRHKDTGFPKFWSCVAVLKVAEFVKMPCSTINITVSRSQPFCMNSSRTCCKNCRLDEPSLRCLQRTSPLKYADEDWFISWIF